MITNTIDSEAKSKRLYSLKESASELNLSYSTIKSWVHLKRLPVVKLGSRTMIKAKVLEMIFQEGLEAVRDIKHKDLTNKNGESQHGE